MSNFFYCPGCKEIVQGSDPCSCVFNVQGVLDVNGVLHTAKRVDLGPLAQALADFNAETLRWIAEDPTQRWGGLLVEDLAHWVRYGITTPAELAEYLDQCAAQWASEDWPGEGDHGEMAYRRINRTDPNYDPEYLRPHVDDPCYECGCLGARLELCHDGITRPLCTPCWSYLYRH